MDTALEVKDLEVSGVVASMPEVREYATRFSFDIERIHADGAAERAVPKRVRLSWYTPAPEVRMGERWRFTVRIKRPLGFMNPGGFDYEGWLYQQGIRATGYVRDGHNARQLEDNILDRPLGRIREALADEVAARLPQSANVGIITGLTIGERHAIAPEQWRLLLATGTNHLLAISGMNISLIAGLVYFLMRRLWRTSAQLCLMRPASHAAAIAALMAGFVYAALAGFSIPTQRAVIMLAVVIGAQLLGRTSRPGHTLAAALLAVLVSDPRAVLSAGFLAKLRGGGHHRLQSIRPARACSPMVALDEVTVAPDYRCAAPYLDLFSAHRAAGPAGQSDRGVVGGTGRNPNWLGAGVDIAAVPELGDRALAACRLVRGVAVAYS